MKKMLTVLVLMMAFMAMTSVVATAHDGCASKTTKTETAEKATKTDKAKAGCTGHTDATHAAHKAECTHHDGVKCASVNLSIEGMVCQSCESVIKGTLTEMPGVLAVEKISYKEGKALVCIDPAKVKDAELVKAVTNKGYKAEVMTAVATDATTATATKASAKTPCSKKCAKTCASATKTAAKDSKDTGDEHKKSCDEKKSH